MQEPSGSYKLYRRQSRPDKNKTRKHALTLYSSIFYSIHPICFAKQQIHCKKVSDYGESLKAATEMSHGYKASGTSVNMKVGLWRISYR